MAKLKYVMYQLNSETLRQVRKNPQIIGLLATVHKKQTWSIQRWLKENHQDLTLYSSLQIISKELGKTKAECLEVKKGVKLEIQNLINPPSPNT